MAVMDNEKLFTASTNKKGHKKQLEFFKPGVETFKGK